MSTGGTATAQAVAEAFAENVGNGKTEAAAQVRKIQGPAAVCAASCMMTACPRILLCSMLASCRMGCPTVDFLLALPLIQWHLMVVAHQYCLLYACVHAHAAYAGFLLLLFLHFAGTRPGDIHRQGHPGHGTGPRPGLLFGRHCICCSYCRCCCLRQKQGWCEPGTGTGPCADQL